MLLYTFVITLDYRHMNIILTVRFSFILEAHKQQFVYVHRKVKEKAGRKSQGNTERYLFIYFEIENEVVYIEIFFLFLFMM